jgi:hypothetical protein
VYSVSFRLLAFEDLQEIIYYYDSINPKLSDIFLSEIDKTIDLLKSFPLSCPLKFGNIRVSFLKNSVMGFILKYIIMKLELLQYFTIAEIL